MICPHCGETIPWEPTEPKVHLRDRSYGSEICALCGRYPERLTDDKAGVTCRNCRRTRVFKEAR